MNIHTPFYILSAERSNISQEFNAARTRQLAEQLTARGLDFAPVTGSYQGATESLFIVLDDADAHGDTLAQLARRYGQESILAVDANRNAELIYINQGIGGNDTLRAEPIGRWAAISAERAPEFDGWTLDARGNYYTVLSTVGA